MAYYQKKKKKVGEDSYKWYPQAVTSGSPITTQQVAKRLAAISTVSYADVQAVLAELAGVMADYMALGKTVKLDGLGTFYYTITAGGNGVDTPEEVNVGQITGVRVRFIPEATRSGVSKSSPMTRTLVAQGIEWEEWGGKQEDDGGQPGTGGCSGTGGSDDGEGTLG